MRSLLLVVLVAAAAPLASAGPYAHLNVVAAGTLLPGETTEVDYGGPCFGAVVRFPLLASFVPSSSDDVVRVDVGYYPEPVTAVLTAESPAAFFDGASPHSCMPPVTLEGTSLAAPTTFQLVEWWPAYIVSFVPP